MTAYHSRPGLPQTRRRHRSCRRHSGHGRLDRHSQPRVPHLPVLWFREPLQKLGLLRKYRSRLLLTKAGSTVRGNPEALWRPITDRLPLGKTDSMDVPAGLLALLLSGSTPGAQPSSQRIAQALSHLGWRHSDRTPVTADTVRWATADTLGVLENVTIGPRRRSEAGPDQRYRRRPGMRHPTDLAQARVAKPAGRCLWAVIGLITHLLVMRVLDQDRPERDVDALRGS